jgi:hypothetical protein
MARKARRTKVAVIEVSQFCPAGFGSGYQRRLVGRLPHGKTNTLPGLVNRVLALGEARHCAQKAGKNTVRGKRATTWCA